MSNPLEATFARFMGIFMNGWTKGMGKCPKKWNFGTFGTLGHPSVSETFSEQYLKDYLRDLHY